MSPRRSLAVVVLAALPFAAACGAGHGSETERERTSPYAANTSVGSMLVRAASVLPATVTPTPSENPAASGSASPSPSPSTSAAQAYLLVTFVNHGSSADTLTGASAGNGAVQPSGGGSGPLTIAPGRTLSFGDPESGGTGTALTISGLSAPPRIGSSVLVSFTFQNAGTVRLPVPVRDPATIGTTATSTPIPYTGSYPALPTEVPGSAGPAASESSTP